MLARNRGKCRTCGKLIQGRTSTNYVRHMLVKHPKETRDTPWKITGLRGCPKILKHRIWQHFVRKEDDECECRHCSEKMSCGEMADLKTHLRDEHPEEIMSEPTLFPPPESGEVIVCKFCMASCATNQTFKQHFKRKHQDILDQKKESQKAAAALRALEEDLRQEDLKEEGKEAAKHEEQGENKEEHSSEAEPMEDEKEVLPKGFGKYFSLFSVFFFDLASFNRLSASRLVEFDKLTDIKIQVGRTAEYNPKRDQWRLAAEID